MSKNYFLGIKLGGGDIFARISDSKEIGSEAKDICYCESPT